MGDVGLESGIRMVSKACRWCPTLRNDCDGISSTVDKLVASYGKRLEDNSSSSIISKSGSLGRLMLMSLERIDVIS